MKKTIFLLMICLIFSGLPVEASLAPGCGAVMSMPVGAHPCCGNSCDCSVKTRSQDLFQKEVSFDSRFETVEFKLTPSDEGILPAKPIFSFKNDKSPPERKNHLYDLYSDYRI